MLVGTRFLDLNLNSNSKLWGFLERLNHVGSIYVPPIPQQSPRAFTLEMRLLSKLEDCMSESTSADSDNDSCVERDRASIRECISNSSWGSGISVNSSSGHGKSPIISVIVNRGGVRKKMTNWMSRRKAIQAILTIQRD